MKKQKNADYWGFKHLFLLLAGFVLVVGPPLHGDTFYVDTTADTVDAAPGDGSAADAGGNCSLRAAIMEANALAGTDEIHIPAGIYKLTNAIWREDLCVGGDLDILENLNIYGAGQAFTFIEGVRDRVFHILFCDVEIEDLTIREGLAPHGVALGTSTWDYDGLDGSGGDGGAILIENGELVLRRCTLKDNRAGRGGTYNWGLGIQAGAGGKGGAIYNALGDLVIKDSIIKRNITGRGGYYTNTMIEIDGSGGRGGAIYNESGTVTIRHTSLIDNRTERNGGAMETWKRSGHGGAVYNDGGVCIIEYSDIYANSTGDAYCGMECSGGNGAGIYNDGTLVVDHSTIRRNHAGDGGCEGHGGSGGGIYNAYEADVSKSAIYGNVTGEGDEYPTGCGGGIFNRYKMIVVNSTISGNRHQITGGYYLGGGIYNWDGELYLESCTVANNETSWDGAGIYNDSYSIPSSIVYMHNTIVGDNFITGSSAPDDCWGEITSQGWNLIEDTTNCIILGTPTGDIYGMDPQLDILNDNGGATWTHELIFGSPCIDAGDSGAFEPTDQRDVVRPQDGDGDSSTIPDIGAYEKSLSTSRSRSEPAKVQNNRQESPPVKNEKNH